MQQAQSIAIFLGVVVLAVGPAAFLWAYREDARDVPEEPLSSLLPAREALARHMYGEAVGWSSEALEDYDNSELVRRTWLREADIALRRDPTLI